jgi:hypothetical protein
MDNVQLVILIDDGRTSIDFTLKMRFCKTVLAHKLSYLGFRVDHRVLDMEPPFFRIICFFGGRIAHCVVRIQLTFRQL